MRFLFFIILLFYSTAGVAQKKTPDIVVGKWKITHRLPVVDNYAYEELDSLDYKTQLLQKSDTVISFNNGDFVISQTRKGKYFFRGIKLYLEGKEFWTTYYSDNKFSLVRKVSPNVILSYMLERIKE